MKPSLRFAIIAAMILAYFPLVAFPLTRGLDLVWHWRWIEHFSAQLFQGDVYPRWLMDANQGFGSPAFYIYPPLSSYLAAPLWILQPDPAHGDRVVGCLIFIGLLASVFAMWRFLRDRASPDAAWIAAGLYGLLPYHGVINGYQRTAVAELWAMTWIPIALLAALDIRARPRVRFIWSTAATVLLLLTHAPTSFVTLPLAGAAALALGAKEKQWRSLAAYAAGQAAGIAICSAYLFTALTFDRYTDVEDMFHLYPIFESFMTVDSTRIVYRTVYGTIAFGVVALGAALYAARFSKSTRERLLAAAAWCFLVFLLFPASEPIWYAVPWAYKVQFAWRVTALLTFGAAWAFAVAYDDWEPIFRMKWRWPLLKVAAAALLLALTAGELAYGWVHSRMPMRPKEALMLERREEPPEYRPGGKVPPVDYFSADSRAVVLSGQANVQVRRWDPGEIRLQVTAQEPSEIAIRQFYYTGWQATANGRQLEVEKRQHIVLVHAPQGDLDLSITRTITPVERLGNQATLAALAVFLLIGLYLWRKELLAAARR